MTRRLIVSVVGLAWGSLAVLGVAAAAGLRVNTTRSMPQGLWRAHPLTGVVRAGDAVVVCLPPTAQTRRYIGPGTCPNGLEPLLKTVGAVAGDVVSLDAAGASVNGRLLPGTAALTADGAGRALAAYPAGHYRVQSGQIYLFSSHDPAVYDSRYFGPVNTATIVAMGKPVFTFK